MGGGQVAGEIKHGKWRKRKGEENAIEPDERKRKTRVKNAIVFVTFVSLIIWSADGEKKKTEPSLSERKPTFQTLDSMHNFHNEIT